MPSAFKDVISQLQKQRAAIDRAIAALEEVGDETVEPTEIGRRERPAKKGSVTKKAGRKRTLSPEARQRIAEAQRKRWAASKKGTKKAAAKKAD